MLDRMIRRALLAVSALVVQSTSGCAQQRATVALPGSAPTGSTEIPVQRFREPTDAGFAQFSGFGSPTRLIIRDAETWKAHWATIHRPIVPSPPVPEIDFAREMVILAAAGTKPNEGHVIRITDATANASRLLVTVRHSATGDGCVVSAVISQPVDIVRIPATSLPVEFADVTTRVDCAPGAALRR